MNIHCSCGPFVTCWLQREVDFYTYCAALFILIGLPRLNLVATVENNTEATFCLPKHKEIRGKCGLLSTNNGSFLLLNKISEFLKVGHANDFLKTGGVVTVHGRHH